MATYNGSLFLKKQIDSILCQLCADDELIISDDSSTDDTLKIIESYNDKRIKVLYHQREKSKYYPKMSVPYASFNFENALKEAKGDYIFLSDQDDIWLPSKIKECTELLKQYDYVLTNLSIIDEQDNIVCKKMYSKKPFTRNIIKNCFHPIFWGCCACFTQKILQASLPFPKSTCLHDFWIGLVATKTGTMFWFDKPLVLHRVGSQNTSTGGKKSNNSLWMKFLYRFYAFFEYIKLK
ncbi:MAG: glycosyltransferase [Treponema sp.]|nr:glycosyltransferase [Treponema sp.]